MQRKAIITLALLLLGHAAGCSYFNPRRTLTWQITLELSTPVSDRQKALNDTIQIIKHRLDRFGLPTFDVRAEDNSSSNRITVQLPEVPDRERVKQLIATQGNLELVHVISPPSPAPVQTFASQDEAIRSVGGQLPSDRRVLLYSDRVPRFVIVESPSIVNGHDLRSASAVASQPDNFEIVFSLNSTGAQKLGAWTASNINQYMGVAYNGEVRSIALIKSQVFDSGQIGGRFSKAAAEDLAQVLNSGPLPVAVRIVEATR